MPDSRTAQAGVSADGRGVWRCSVGGSINGRPAAAAPGAIEKQVEKAQTENLATLLQIDDLSLEIGFQLISMVDEKQGGQMLARVRTLRRHLASELGFLVPPIHISDNLRLKPREYVFSLRGVEIGRWQTEANCLLAVSQDPQARPLAGQGDPRAGVWRECPLDPAGTGGPSDCGGVFGGRPGDGDLDPSGGDGAPACP